MIGVQGDSQGIMPERLEQACRQHRPGLVYLNPTLQNPTAITLAEDRRQEIASIAKRCHVRIVEDDPYRSEEHTSELQSHLNLVCRLLLEKKKKKRDNTTVR